MTNRSAMLALILLLGFTLTATALAHVDAMQESGQEPGASQRPISVLPTNSALRPVDQGTADLGELNTSSRLIPIDLRQPLDFGRLYEAPDQTGRLMRVSGGISAVFPRSEYAASAGFIFPVIPAGTEFFIGPMSESPFQSSDQGSEPAITAVSTARSSFIDSRINSHTDSLTSNRLDGSGASVFEQTHASNNPGLTLEELLTGRTGGSADQPRLSLSIWSNERYRQSRIASLLAKAHEHGLR